MTYSMALRPLAVAAALMSPIAAQAATHMTLDFTGTVGRTATGVVSPYLEEPLTTSFAGEPITISVDLAQSGGVTYVDAFSAQWSDDTYDAPFITGYSGDGLPDTPGNENVFGFLSTVVLTDTGGSIFITPTSLFIASTDGDFNLSFNFTYSSPHAPFTSFTDPGVTGGGTFDAFFTFLIDPVLGPYDADSAGPFTLTSVTGTATAPEPGVWALMIMGFGATGAALRRRRALPVAG